MILFGSLLLGIFCIVLYAVFLAVWIGALFVFRVRHKVLWSLPSLPVFVLLLYTCSLLLSRPSTPFKDSFGFAPPPDVTILQSFEEGFGDYGITYLHFKANPATVQRIVSKGMVQVGPTTATPSSTNSTPPDWWQPPDKSVEKFIGSIGKRNFAREEDYLVYDPATGDVWYRFMGID